MSKDKQLMIDEIDAEIKWLEQLKEDLETGKAKLVPQKFGHVYQHLLPEGPLPQMDPGAMITRETCTDILKLWACYFYIATCPTTGTRFVEDAIGKEGGAR